MQKCVLALEKISDDAADARQVKDFNTDRSKRALAIVVADFLEKGESAAAAEWKARSSPVYGSALHDLMEQYKAALRVIEKQDALRTKFEASRSLLSVEKAKMGLL